MHIIHRVFHHADLEAADWGGDPRRVDYGKIYAARFGLLRRAFQAGYPRDRAAVEAFRLENPWLDNYALYMALKARFGMKSWLDWPDEDLRLRQEKALEQAREELAEDIAFYAYLQYLFGQCG